MTHTRFLYLTVLLIVEYHSTQNIADLILSAPLVTVSFHFDMYFFFILSREGPFVACRPPSDSGRGVAPTALEQCVLVGTDGNCLGDHVTFQFKIT